MIYLTVKHWHSVHFASCMLALLANYQNIMSFGIHKYAEAVQNLELLG